MIPGFSEEACMLPGTDHRRNPWLETPRSCSAAHCTLWGKSRAVQLFVYVIGFSQSSRRGCPWDVGLPGVTLQSASERRTQWWLCSCHWGSRQIRVLALLQVAVLSDWARNHFHFDLVSSKYIRKSGWSDGVVVFLLEVCHSSPLTSGKAALELRRPRLWAWWFRHVWCSSLLWVFSILSGHRSDFNLAAVNRPWIQIEL